MSKSFQSDILQNLTYPKVQSVTSRTSLFFPYCTEVLSTNNSTGSRQRSGKTSRQAGNAAPPQWSMWKFTIRDLWNLNSPGHPSECERKDLINHRSESRGRQDEDTPCPSTATSKQMSCSGLKRNHVLTPSSSHKYPSISSILSSHMFPTQCSSQ